MVLFRDMTFEEYNLILDGKFNSNPSDYQGMHFFKYYGHAKAFLSHCGEMIVMCNMSDELIKEMDYVNFQYKNYPVGVPIPEYIMDRKDFDKDFITGINPEKFCFVNFGRVYDKFLKDKYNEFLRINGHWFKTPYVFYDYVTEYLKDKNLDEVIENYARLTPAKKLRKKR